jgi:hypothetical protein
MDACHVDGSGGVQGWKREPFDADPAGRKQAAKGYRLYCGVDNPNEVIVQIGFTSAEVASPSSSKYDV